MSDPLQSALPGIKHKVIGLVSGGKDSCFNLMHCVANGHEIVALATLTPEPGVDELDSHLYQSVGTNLIHLIAKSMDLPLYTRVIKGKAVSRGPEYGSRLKGGEGSGQEGDETEDLTKLLKDVMERHPEATALSSGAILSTYQRLRIEHVCSRLSLVSLAYLWQSQQLPLLDRMLSCDMDIVLMKVAGVGLGTDVVGKRLGEIMPLLRKLEARYGSHPAGEGGEYETFTLSTPLFSHKVKLNKCQTIITDPEPYPVAYLKIEDAELEAKAGWTKPSVKELRQMLGLDQDQRDEEGLDDKHKDLLGELGSHIGFDQLQISPQVRLHQQNHSMIMDPVGMNARQVRVSRKGRWFSASMSGTSIKGEDVAQELRRCLDAISQTLESNNLSLPLHTVHITLLLSSMALFLPANEVYKSYFGTSPPSRATVAVPLSGARVRVEIVGFDDAPFFDSKHTKEGEEAKFIGNRNALHVQGLSYWAPANIGPYSQAVMVNNRVHLAGQIPLLPPSLTLPLPPLRGSPYSHQAVLALQHVGRIADVLRSKNYTGGGWEGWIESCTAWWATPLLTNEMDSCTNGLKIVMKAWDLWIERNGDSRTPVIFVQAKELPKSALIEYQVNLHSGRKGVDPLSASAVLDDDEDEDLQPVYEAGQEHGIRWEAYHASGLNQGSRGGICVRDMNDLSSVSTITSTSRLFDNAVTMRIYHLDGVELTTFLSMLKCNYTLVPVLSIHDKLGKAAVMGLEVFGI
uniref:Diphthine--ammonia ligase n=1 Tax=Kwoniella pini CBS 10737 TaxID=1296096 RepID=A0A1B9HUT5_9TREE|nr:cytoplasmic protein [Kwoniella pini CBS 10737]OCF47032.1 cytoplasmic protein [Kwoniella pini CBS 10737]